MVVAVAQPPPKKAESGKCRVEVQAESFLARNKSCCPVGRYSTIQKQARDLQEVDVKSSGAKGYCRGSEVRSCDCERREG